MQSSYRVDVDVQIGSTKKGNTKNKPDFSLEKQNQYNFGDFGVNHLGRGGGSLFVCLSEGLCKNDGMEFHET